MDEKTYKSLTPAQRAQIDTDLSDAYDFDRRDPLFGLTRDDAPAP